MRVPVSTYRLQLTRDLGFARARDLVPYLDRLGVTDLYLSPIFRSRPGSTHGYDVCDPTELDPERGGRAGFESLAAAARERGMGIVADFVPNHMAADAAWNPWWRDVLANGRDSTFARFFDLHPGESITLPILGRDLPACLEAGEIRLVQDGGRVEVGYYDRRLPLRPDDEKAFDGATDLQGRALEEILGRQAYRLASFREPPGYRRFFDVNDLVALRVEDPVVFDAVHATLLDLVARGDVTGIRLDHVDGLRDPGAYLRRLRDRAGDVWIVVEKILTGEETLPASWPVDGTTGYEFLNDVTRVFVDPDGLAELRRAHASFTGLPDPEEVRDDSKREVLATLFPGELERLTSSLAALPGAPAREAIEQALLALLVAFPVYRTYAASGRASEADRAVLARAVQDAERTAPERTVILSWLARLLAEPSPETLDAIASFEQLAAPAQAKGVEDTFCYRWAPLLALAEVGGEPDARPLSVDEFHARNLERLRGWPRSMLASSTHDTKRGEDVRARLAALSELASEWREAVEGWALANVTLRDTPGAPSRRDEWMLYQTLAGIWPPAAERADDGFVERIRAFLLKAAREAKIETRWRAPDEAYETALDRFASALLRDPPFARSFRDCRDRVAEAGLRKSLAQILLHAFSPGVPDVYQGTELWDLSLVDPDNRRPVDFALREELLRDIDRTLAATGEERARLVEDIVATWRDGRLKLFVRAVCLRLRRKEPDLFLEGSYEPIPAPEGVVAFARTTAHRTLVVACRARGDASSPTVTLPPGLRDHPLVECFFDRPPCLDEGRAVEPHPVLPTVLLGLNA